MHAANASNSPTVQGPDHTKSMQMILSLQLASAMFTARKEVRPRIQRSHRSHPELQAPPVSKSQGKQVG